MSSRQIDQVLKAAVGSGGVTPCVVAMATDDEGVVYEGGAGTRTCGVLATAAAQRRGATRRRT